MNKTLPASIHAMALMVLV